MQDSKSSFDENSRIEYAENVLAASMMAQTLNCCVERKYLDTIAMNDSLVNVEVNEESKKTFKNISWLRILQVSRPINDTVAHCFGYIQKILLSCAIPDVQLTFLVVGDGAVNELYIGLRNNSGNSNIKISRTVADLDNFIHSCWPGIVTEQFSEQNRTLERHFNTTYGSVKVLTGIPSLADDRSAIGNVEHLIGGLRGQKYAYLVTAVPVGNDRLQDLLNQCRDLGGQIESVKSINISRSAQEGSSHAHTVGRSLYKSVTETNGTQQKDYKKGIGMAMLGAGVYMAAGIFFPPAMAILPGLGAAMGASMHSDAPLLSFLGISGMTGMNVLSGFVPTNSHSTGTSEGESHQTSDTETYSKSMTESLSRTLVNKHAEAAAEKLNRYASRFEQAKATGAWNVKCFLFTEQSGSSASMQLKSLLSGEESTLEPIRIHDVSDVIGTKGRAKTPHLMVRFKNGPLFEHPFGDDFSQLQTLLTTRELSALINFPLHSVPGISVVDSAPEFSLTPQNPEGKERLVNLGKLLYGGSSSKIDVYLPLDTLSRHAMVCGVNGSGKTNTVLKILDGFMRGKLPFMVIEPAKTEYVDWALKYNDSIDDPARRIKIFMPGCQRYVRKDTGEAFTPMQLRLNPFEVIDLGGNELKVISHIDRLKDIFAAAFPMQDILPVVIEHLLYLLYTDVCQMLEPDDLNYMKKGYPTVKDVNRDTIKSLMTELGYAQENTQNISAALRTRFHSMRYGWKKEMLCNQKLDMKWEELFGSPCIINVSNAGDDTDRAFIMSLLLQFLYEYRIAETEMTGYSFNENRCRHLVVVEEAHRVMGYCPDPNLPQYRSARMCSNFLSEVRAYGQGMMVVDQVPSRLIEDAVKNTNVKIIHKLVAADDARMVAECIGLSEQQMKVIPRLSIGQGVLSGLNSADVTADNAGDIYLAKIDKMK